VNNIFSGSLLGPPGSAGPLHGRVCGGGGYAPALKALNDQNADAIVTVYQKAIRQACNVRLMFVLLTYFSLHIYYLSA